MQSFTYVIILQFWIKIKFNLINMLYFISLIQIKLLIRTNYVPHIFSIENRVLIWYVWVDYCINNCNKTTTENISKLLKLISFYYFLIAIVKFIKIFQFYIFFPDLKLLINYFSLLLYFNSHTHLKNINKFELV